jgi:uncharacterized protein YutE (UPF0331/DUF86 family)
MARIDREAVAAHLAAIEDAVTVLQGLSHLSPADLAATERLWAVSHGLQLAIQNVLDVATHVVTALDAGAPPEDYRGALLRLGELGVLRPEFAAQIAPMAGLRNILVHGYLRLEVQRLVDALQRLDDLAAFTESVRAFLDANAAL